MSVTTTRGVQVRDNDLTDADVAAANKDGVAGTYSLRTLGTSATQAAAGNHAHTGTYVPVGRTITTNNGLTGGGDLSADRTFSLSTPGTLSVSSGNSAVSAHTHAVTSSSNPGAVASLLASDASGNLQLVMIGLGTGAGTSGVSISGATGTYASGIGFLGTGTGARTWRTYVDTNGALVVDDLTAGATRLRLSSVGALGVGAANPTAQLEVNPAVVTTGSPVAFKINAAAHTTLTKSEFNDVYFQLNRTVNFASGGGTIPIQRSVYISSPTYTATTNPLTITDAYTLYVSSEPTASTNVTIGTGYAIYAFSNASNAHAIHGSASLSGIGVYGESLDNIGVYGATTGITGGGYGGYFTAATGYALVTVFGNVGLGTAFPVAFTDVLQPNLTGGSPTAFKLRGGSHVTITKAEFNDVYIDLSRTVNFSSGGATIATMRSVLIDAPTYTATTNAITLMTAATVAIAGAPVASTNITITTPLSLWVQAGNVLFAGNLNVNGAATFAGATSVDPGSGSANATFSLTARNAGVAKTATIVTNQLGGLLLTPLASGDNTVAIGGASPINLNMLAVYQRVAIGATFVATSAPANGLIVEGTVGFGTVAPATLLSVGIGADGAQFGIHSLTELTTIAAAAFTNTTIQFPAGCLPIAASVRVTVAIPTAATFKVGQATNDTRFATGLSVAINTKDAGSSTTYALAAGSFPVKITPNLTPATNVGRVRVTIWYMLSTPPTS